MEKESEALALFRKLEKEGIEYLVVGGMAVVLYGVERATFDIDIAIAARTNDIKRLLKALAGIGYSEVVDVVSEKHIAAIDKIKADEVLKLESVKIKNGYSVDILTVPAETFDFMREYKVEVVYKGAKIFIPSLIDLIRLKERSGRLIDLEDAKRLRHILRTRGKK